MEPDSLTVQNANPYEKNLLNVNGPNLKKKYQQIQNSETVWKNLQMFGRSHSVLCIFFCYKVIAVSSLFWRTNLKVNFRHLKGEDITSLNHKELMVLEDALENGISSIRDRQACIISIITYGRSSSSYLHINFSFFDYSSEIIIYFFLHFWNSEWDCEDSKEKCKWGNSLYVSLLLSFIRI